MFSLFVPTKPQVGQHMNNAAYSLRLVYGKYLGKYEVYRNDQVRSCARALARSSTLER